MKTAIYAAGFGLAALSTSANAITVSDVGGTLGSFSYTVVGDVITIEETWTSTSPVFLLFEDVGFGTRYTVRKNIVNDSGTTFISLAHELLDTAGDGDDGLDPLIQPSFVPVGFSTSNDSDGLTFADPRISDAFPGLIIDELSDARDFMDFTGGSVADGGSFYVEFDLFGLANEGDFLLSQRANTLSIPEPATWAFMMLGFGAIGGAFRRQRARTTVSYG